LGRTACCSTELTSSWPRPDDCPSGQTEHVYGETPWAAKTWPSRRRIIKAEVTRHPGRDPKDNRRFVVTNMTQTPRWVYEEFYCRRGEIENRIKELHHGLEIDNAEDVSCQ
jgi:hypothetical protein